MKYKALIFDLDDTLFETWEQVSKYALLELANLLVKHGLQASIEQILSFRTNVYAKNPRMDFWSSLVEKFGSTGMNKQDLIGLARKTFYERKVCEDVSVIPGVLEMLHDLRCSYRCYLVTSGNHSAQLHKVKKLGLENSFDAIYCMDPTLGQKKSEAFKKIMKLNNFRAEDCLSIGNRLDNEIKEANLLGIPSCYVCHGEYVHMRAMDASEEASFKVNSVLEIPEIIALDCKKNIA